MQRRSQIFKEFPKNNTIFPEHVWSKYNQGKSKVRKTPYKFADILGCCLNVLPNISTSSELQELQDIRLRVWWDEKIFFFVLLVLSQNMGTDAFMIKIIEIVWRTYLILDVRVPAIADDCNDHIQFGAFEVFT